MKKKKKRDTGLKLSKKVWNQTEEFEYSLKTRIIC